MLSLCRMLHFFPFFSRQSTQAEDGRWRAESWYFRNSSSSLLCCAPAATRLHFRRQERLLIPDPRLLKVWRHLGAVLLFLLDCSVLLRSAPMCSSLSSVFLRRLDRWRLPWCHPPQLLFLFLYSTDCYSFLDLLWSWSSLMYILRSAPTPSYPFPTCSDLFYFCSRRALMHSIRFQSVCSTWSNLLFTAFSLTFALVPFLPCHLPWHHLSPSLCSRPIWAWVDWPREGL